MSGSKRIISARRKLGMSQPRLAAALGVNQSTISRWEAGVNPPKAALQLVSGWVDGSIPLPEREAVSQ